MQDMATESPVTGIPVDDTLFTLGEHPQLVGSQCAACGVVTFPRAKSCSRCTGTEMNEALLPNRGTLWSWTVQGFLPKNPPYAGKETPLTFRPYGVGYISLDPPGGGDGVIVESRLTESDPAKLKIGMTMEMRLIAFTTDDAGRDIITFAFVPVEHAS
jgi:uncharacterized OB-fold protein